MSRLCRNEDGALTPFGLIMMIALFCFSGLAVDVANAYMIRTQLQATADAAAHAALYLRQTETSGKSIQLAVDLAANMMPSGANGTVLRDQDITFGYWDEDLRIFTPDASSKDAVMVDTGRMASRSNPVATYFLAFAGLDSWNIRRGAVYETYVPTCFREGFVADGLVDVQSNNVYTNGFCIHSNTHVEVNSNNYFAANTIVSMPDIREIVLPNSGYSTNDGLYDSLRDAAYRMRLVNQLEDIIDDLTVAGVTYTPTYIDNYIPVTLTATTVSDADFVAGTVNIVDCDGAASLTISANTVLTDVVVITDCAIKLGNNVSLEGAILATTDTGTKSVNGSHLQLGRDDYCADGGSAQLLTLGGVEVSSDLQVFGSQIIAKGDISFAANADGIEGASLIAGGVISGTSNMTMGFCGTGMDDNFTAEYFRLVS